LNVIFVCWGNICRSPMGRFVAEKWFAEAGLDAVVTSAGVSDEEHGNPVYYTAQQVLREHGYAYAPHRAHQITASEIAGADLVIGFEPIHISRMRRIAPQAGNLRLITDFDPDAATDGIADPWGYPASEFRETLAGIEAAMPGILAEVQQLAAAKSKG
jgi:protein-tyrosine phosphatase